MALTLETITFSNEELDYESDSGIPVIITSISSPQVFDSYLPSAGDGGILKLYRPLPNNVSISWDIKVLITRKRLNEINSLILRQTKIVKEYRVNQNTDRIQGFTFQFPPEVNTKVWISSFTNSGSFFSTDRNIELIRCRIGVTEAE